jgi:hypothetical protein
MLQMAKVATSLVVEALARKERDILLVAQQQVRVRNIKVQKVSLGAKKILKVEGKENETYKTTNSKYC